MSEIDILFTIERLRAEIECLRQSRAQIRAEMREECAKVAELYVNGSDEQIERAREIYDVIRSLKDDRH